MHLKTCLDVHIEPKKKTNKYLLKYIKNHRGYINTNCLSTYHTACEAAKLSPSSQLCGPAADIPDPTRFRS